MLKLNRNCSEECPGVCGFCVLEVSHGEFAELTTVEPSITDGPAPCLGLDPFDGCRDGFNVRHGIDPPVEPNPPNSVQSACPRRCFKGRQLRHSVAAPEHDLEKACPRA